MRWLVGGLLVGALLAGGIAWWQLHPSKECGGDDVVVAYDYLPVLAPDEGQRDPESAAGLALRDTSHVVSDPGSPGADDDVVRYYSYDGRRLDEVVEVRRADDGLWYAGRLLGCGT